MESLFKEIAGGVALALEVVAVLFVATGAVSGFYGIAQALAFSPGEIVAKKQVWLGFGAWLLLGLEFELGADIIRTAIAPTWQQLGQLGVIAVIRTFLNYFLERDLEKYARREAPAKEDSSSEFSTENWQQQTQKGTMRNIRNKLAIGGLSAKVALAALTGCESMNMNKSHDERSEGRVIDDKNITKDIKARLKDEPTFKFDSVDVSTFGGIVQLSGFVNHPDQRRRAEDIARHTGGVTQVVNGLVVKQGSTLTPTGQPTGQRMTTMPATQSAPSQTAPTQTAPAQQPPSQPAQPNQ